MNNFEIINSALKVLGLPSFLTFEELKERYRILAKQNHPDFKGNKEKMRDINRAYNILKEYMLGYKFSFSKDEVNKQFPQDDYIDRFRF